MAELAGVGWGSVWQSGWGGAGLQGVVVCICVSQMSARLGMVIAAGQTCLTQVSLDATSPQPQ